VARTFLRQETQIRNSDTYDDTLAAGTTLETVPTEIEKDLNGLRSQIKRLIWDDSAGNWYDDVPTINSKKRGIRDLNFDLDELESQKVLCRETQLTDITVTAAQNWEILSFAGSEPPPVVAAVALTVNGAVIAQSALSGAGFNVHELTEIAGGSAIYPKNLMLVRDSTTGQAIQSSGRDIFALLQYESTGVDGAAFDDVSGGNRAKLSFVRMNAALDDLEACPVADIASLTINYAWVRRYTLDDVPEDCFLGQSSFVDGSANSDVTRQRAYDNQGTTVVELTSNATLDLNSAGIAWKIRDLVNTDLLKILEGSTGGTSEIQFGVDVDTFNNDAIVNDFRSGLKAATNTVEIDVGITAIAGVGTVETTGSNDLRTFGSRELFLDDGNQSGSTWAQTSGIKLSDTTAEWDDYETAFGGEVSLLRGIYLARTVNARGTKTYANVTSTTVADSDVSLANANLDVALPAMSAGTFTLDYDVFLNGDLLRPGADASANHDYYPGSVLTPAARLKFEFTVKTNDVICVIPWA
jgi:hypothetical protein